MEWRLADINNKLTTSPPTKQHSMKVSFLFAWYDIWVGAFWDQKKKWLYILPVPCFGIIIKFNRLQQQNNKSE